jgi:hypothetical protein
VTPPKELSSDRGLSLMAGEERRRSQRVIIRVPVTLEATMLGQKVKAEAFTVAVNIHGAMVLCPRSFDAETKLEIRNDRTGQSTVVRVTRAPRESAEGYLLPLEFISPSPNFWQISFPPENWKSSSL